jgi:hypothetical protein
VSVERPRFTHQLQGYIQTSSLHQFSTVKLFVRRDMSGTDALGQAQAHLRRFLTTSTSFLELTGERVLLKRTGKPQRVEVGIAGLDVPYLNWVSSTPS